MSTVTAALKLYREAATDAVRAFARTWLAMLALIAGNVAVLAAVMITSTMPPGVQFVAGFGIALLLAGAVGWYLALVDVGIGGRRTLKLGDLTSFLGRHLWDVIGVMFVFWIASLLLGFTLGRMGPMELGPVVIPSGAWLVTTLFAVASILFNPAPELVYQGRSSGGVELLGEALSFMQRNWPEWLVPHAVAVAVLVGIDVVIGLPLSQAVVLHELDVFGPHFGLAWVASKALGLQGFGMFGLADPASASLDAAAVRIAAGVGLLVFTHFWMLFRGSLFAKLSSGSRRARAWQARLR